MGQDVLYLKIDQNVCVYEKEIRVKSIAEIECSNKDMENRINSMKLPELKLSRHGKYVKSVMEVIAGIHKEYPQLEIQNLGEADFIISYEKAKEKDDLLEWIKTAAVSILCFFGAAFSIMTFNNDVDVPRLFGQVYQLFTGQSSDGFTILEISYSLGLGIGVILFFNHFAGKKITEDPTPLDVQMKTYEKEVNETVIANAAAIDHKEEHKGGAVK